MQATTKDPIYLKTLKMQIFNKQGNHTICATTLALTCSHIHIYTTMG